MFQVSQSYWPEIEKILGLHGVKYPLDIVFTFAPDLVPRATVTMLLDDLQTKKILEFMPVMKELPPDEPQVIHANSND